MKSMCLAVLCALSLHCAAMTGFDEDYDAALARAKTANTPLFVLFTGSDWCIWCKRLESEVLSKPEFLDFATNAYTLAVVDMPSDKSKQSAGRRRRNSELVAKYKVKEEGGRVVFLRRIAPGVAEKSFGIHVGAMAGLPQEVVDRAKQILQNLEANEIDVNAQKVVRKPRRRLSELPGQMTFF